MSSSKNKKKKKDFGPPTSISRSRGSGWVVFSVRVAIVHAVLVAAIRVAVGGRFRARRRRSRRGSSLVAGVVAGSEVVAGCRGRGSSLVAGVALCWSFEGCSCVLKGRGVMVFIKFPG